MRRTRADVVIIGGGVMGVSTAFHLTQFGISDVILLEKENFLGTGATGRCAGGIRYQFGSEINVRLSLMSLPMLDRFKDEFSQPIDLRKCGYLLLVSNKEDERQFKRNIAMQNRLGVESKWLSASEVRNLAPDINIHGIRGAAWNADDGIADPNSVVQGYAKAARLAGVAIETGVSAQRIDVQGGKVAGVETTRGSIETPVVVNAAGPWASQVGEMAGISLPVVPIKRQIAVTAPIPSLDPGFPFVVDFARSLYFHREGGGILTGMSNPDQAPGYDQSMDDEWELVHIENAIDRLPLLADAGLANRWAGLYEVTPDAHPIIGELDSVKGFYCINGFSGHGFMHGPICGKLLSELIVIGQTESLDIACLSPERFDQEAVTVTEYNVI